MLELYNIKLYFDNDLYLINWDDATKKTFKITVNNSWEKIKAFWLSITNENITNHIETVDSRYIESFWRLINHLQIYKKIDKQLFLTILKKFPFHIHYMLELKQMVDYFGHEVRAFLMDYDRASELLLSKLEVRHTHNTPNYHFPNGCISKLPPKC